MITKRKRKRSIKQLEKDLKKVLYPLIKERDEKYNKGKVCITCGKRVQTARDWQAGHFAKAELCNIAYRYHEQNLNGQCSRCNKYLAGNTIEYEKAMYIKWGDLLTEVIKSNYNKRLPMGFDERGFLEEKIEYYKHNPVSSLEPKND